MNSRLTQQPLRDVSLAFIDVETTGLRPELGHRIIEVAVLRTHGLEIRAEFSSLVNPTRSIDPGAKAVNGISAKMVADQPKFAELIPRLTQLFDNAVIVAHNAPFDMSFLKMEYDIAAQPWPNQPILDTLMLARKQYHFYSNSLGNIAKTLNIAAPNAHRAMGDVLTTFAIFKRFSGDLNRQNRPLVKDWIRMQGGLAWSPSNSTPKLDSAHPIQQALERSLTLKIQYKSSSGHISERLITPISHSGNFVVAFCHLRQDQRTFRLDRIISMELVENDPF